MHYARFARFATLFCLLCVAACCGDDIEIHTDPTVPEYVDPCLGGGPYDPEPYRDEHGGTVLHGGTVRENGGAWHYLTVDPGQTIREIRVRIVPRHHDSLANVGLPAFKLRTSTEAGDDLIAEAADPFAARGADPADATVAAEYSRAHDIVLSVAIEIEPQTRYFVGVGGEWGLGEAQDVQICGTKVVLQ